MTAPPPASEIEWRCAGCGAIGRRRVCSCPTQVIFAHSPDGLIHDVKVENLPHEIADPSRAREDECAGLREEYAEARKLILDQGREVISLRERVSALEEGLRPFAEVADEYADYEHDTFEIWKDVGATSALNKIFALKIYRTARALLSPGKDAHG